MEPMEMDEFVRTQRINIVVRNMLMVQFDDDNAGPNLRAIIEQTPERMLKPEMREALMKHWHEAFDPKKSLAENADARTVAWLAERNR